MFSRCLQAIKSRAHLGPKVQKYSSSAFPALVSSKRKNNKSTTNILPKNSELFRISQNNRRNDSSAAMLFSITKILVGAGSLVGLGLLSIQWIKRRDPKQLDRINRRLNTPLELDFDQTWSRMDRSAETRFIRHLLSSSPSSLLIAVGPSGSGKSNIIKQVLSGRKMTLYVDFKRDPIMNGEEFMFSFLENAGYYVFVPTDFTRLLFRDGDRRGRINAQDAEKALSLMLKVLRREKERGWPNGVPVICLDDYHRVYKNGQGQGGDPFFNKFLDWCLHVEECKLAHIIFITSYASAQLDLDAHPHVRSKRVLLFVDYPSKDQIKKSFSELLSTLKDPPNQHETEWIMRVIGGHMEDLDLVYTALLRGDSYANTLRRLVTDSIGYIEDQLENILQKVGLEIDEGKKEAIYNKYLRLWTMMEMLRDSEAINRRDLIRNIFKENTEELDEYVAAEIICYRNIRKEYIKPATTDQDNTKETTTEKNSNNNSNINTSTANVAESNKAVQKPVDESEYISLLNESLDSVLVSAGSPRLRVAFDVLLKDKRLLEQKQMVEVKLRLKKYTDRLTLLADQRKVLLQEHQTSAGELEKLVTSAEKWRQEIGEELFNDRKQAILAREEKIDVQLKAIEDQIEENQRKKEEQTLQQNVLTNAIATPVQVTHGAK